jgi:signal transduction histidine kinase
MWLARLVGSVGIVRQLPEWLIEPFVDLESGERRKARLLSTLLLCLLALGVASAIVQLAVIPGFQNTFTAMMGALFVLFLAYAGSRTRLYRVSAVLAAAAPALACIAIGVRSPDDRVWYAFILMAVIVSSLFFSIQTAALVAVSIFVVLCLLPVWVTELRAPDRIVPLLALHGILSPLLLVAAHHHSSIEREAQNELRMRDLRITKLEQLDGVARVAGSAAHDLNNLISVIDASVSFLEQGGRDAARDIGGIRAATRRAALLSRRLLALSRGGHTEIRFVKVDEFMKDFQSLLLHLAPPPVRVEIRCRTDGAEIQVDPLQLERVMMNLVVNARDAMPLGGRLVVESSCVEPDAADANGFVPPSSGRHVMIAVTDTGTGMDAATRARIFEPFFTSKADGRGTGLGLSIVKDLVDQAGGHLTVTSELGKGSSFRIYLPARLPEA